MQSYKEKLIVLVMFKHFAELDSLQPVSSNFGKNIQELLVLLIPN